MKALEILNELSKQYKDRSAKSFTIKQQVELANESRITDEAIQELNELIEKYSQAVDKYNLYVDKYIELQAENEHLKNMLKAYNKEKGN